MARKSERAAAGADAGATDHAPGTGGVASGTGARGGTCQGDAGLRRWRLDHRTAAPTWVQPTDDLPVRGQGAGRRCADGTQGQVPPAARTRDQRRSQEPGWSASPAPSPRIMVWRPSCGRSPRWRDLLASARRLRAFPAWPIAGKSTVWRILDDNDIKPHKIRYYLEKRDPDFDRKMQEVLMVYRDVSLYTEGAVHDARPNPIYTVSVDEKPGVQAIGLTAPDLPPVPGKASSVGRDYEYVRHGTVSILAGIDLHSGHIFANVEDRHRSVEFIALAQATRRALPPRTPSSAWCWTIIRLTSPKRPWPISAPVPGASSMFIRPSMVLGST